MTMMQEPEIYIIASSQLKVLSFAKELGLPDGHAITSPYAGMMKGIGGPGVGIMFFTQGYGPTTLSLWAEILGPIKASGAIVRVYNGV